jgi:hypothetical protein
MTDRQRLERYVLAGGPHFGECGLSGVMGTGLGVWSSVAGGGKSVLGAGRMTMMGGVAPASRWSRRFRRSRRRLSRCCHRWVRVARRCAHSSLHQVNLSVEVVGSQPWPAWRACASARSKAAADRTRKATVPSIGTASMYAGMRVCWLTASPNEERGQLCRQQRSLGARARKSSLVHDGTGDERPRRVRAARVAGVRAHLRARRRPIRVICVVDGDQ